MQIEKNPAVSAGFFYKSGGETFNITSSAEGGEFAQDSYLLTLGCLNSIANLTLTRSGSYSIAE